MATSSATPATNEPGKDAKHNVTITDVFRNFPDEKCVEMQTEEGLVFYFESAYDPHSHTTIDTVRGAGKAPKVSRNLEKGNRTSIVMETLFNVFPSNVPMPAFQ